MFEVSDKIKLNEELCPENKRTEKRFQFGVLNYFALFLDVEFEVVRSFRDDHHGDMIEVKAIDDDRFRSNMVFRSEDAVLASKTMVKMDFEILGRVNKYQSSIDELKQREQTLLNFRTQKKNAGTSISNKVLIENWADIRKTREQIKKLEAATDSVFRVKHKIGIFDIDCKEEDIPKKLRSLIRQKRKDSRAVKPEIKTIGGGMTLEKLGGVFTKAGKFLELNEKFAVNIIKESKSPKTTDNYVGIEIEMLAPKSIGDMQKEFIKARLHRYVNIGTDASIHSDAEGYQPMELRICLPENLLESKLKEICDVLRKNDCYANRSCGMHVHLDMRQRDPELSYRNLFRVQDIMLAVQPASRRNNRYCMPNTVAEVKLRDFDGLERRSAINTNSYNKNNMRTIEVRIHEGATKFKDVYNWVKFLVATVSQKKDLSKVVKNIKDLRGLDFVEKSVVDHLEERVEEYSA